MLRMSRICVLAAFAALVVAAPASAAPGSVIVKFKPGASAAQRSSLLGSAQEGGTIRGLGARVVRASDTAALSMVGSGDVTVSGGARCTTSKMGSGSVRCGG